MSAETPITLGNRLSDLERAAAELARFAASQRLSTSIAFDVGLAMDEVLTNVIRYAYDDGAEHEITVRIACGEHALVLEIEDDGRPFNPLEVSTPDTASSLTKRAIGGLGIHLVRSVMDRVEYRRHDDKNVLRMAKKLTQPPPTADAPLADIDIAESRSDDVVVLAIRGRMHGRNADALERRLAAAIAAGDTRLVLDLAELEYVSSAGLRVLLVAAKRLRGIGAIALAAPKDFIRAILSVAGVASLVTIHDDRAAAIAYARRAAPQT